MRLSSLAVSVQSRTQVPRMYRPFWKISQTPSPFRRMTGREGLLLAQVTSVRTTITFAKAQASPVSASVYGSPLR